MTNTTYKAKVYKVYNPATRVTYYEVEVEATWYNPMVEGMYPYDHKVVARTPYATKEAAENAARKENAEYAKAYV